MCTTIARVLDNQLLEKNIKDLNNKNVPRLKIANLDNYYNFRTTHKDFEIETTIYSDREFPLISLEIINKANIPVDYSVKLEKKIIPKTPGFLKLFEKKNMIDSKIGVIDKLNTKKRQVEDQYSNIQPLAKSN